MAVAAPDALVASRHMNPILIVAIALVAVVIIAGLALNPVIAKKNDAAIKACKDALGADSIKVIEPRVVGFATDPEEAGGLRGQGCLALNDSDLMFVTTAGQREFRIPRSSITTVDTTGDPRSDAKAMLAVTYTDATHGTVTASWRLGELPAWLDELGYDWGAEGPPRSDDRLE